MPLFGDSFINKIKHWNWKLIKVNKLNQLPVDTKMSVPVATDAARNSQLDKRMTHSCVSINTARPNPLARANRPVIHAFFFRLDKDLFSVIPNSASANRVRRARFAFGQHQERELWSDPIPEVHD